MDTSKLRKFASFARSALIEQVGTRLKTVLAEKSLARRENPNTVKELEAKIKDLGEKRLIETVAYTWFNRFCALRYMDVNRYTRIGVLSPADGQFQPEILSEAKMGHIDEDLVPAVTRKRVLQLLDGSDPSNDPQGEAYRLLLVSVCNYFHALMPFMFEKIADYTELLLPDDLLSGSSIPAYTREALLPINCSPEHTEESVEVIGWLYQFYIADKKDQVFESLTKGNKIAAESIPAATQLFTPHWIVRYLIENSLGRLWMLNHPDSRLIERMDYYIKPDEPETHFLEISSPEEIKVCDPACGSGHMLTYAFDLLYEIYREEQYPEPEIPSLILSNNLFGVEIDPRAGALAAFALTMKAREKDKRFFTRKPIQNPNVCVLENISIDPGDLSEYMDTVGRDLFSCGLQGVVNQWEEADNFGSLILPLVTDVSDALEILRERQMGQDLFLAGVHQKVLKALCQADYLSPKYHVVVANPPYMGGRNMNPTLKAFCQKHYDSSKADLFATMIERCISLACNESAVAMITMQSWMFLSTFEDLRHTIVMQNHVSGMAHLGARAFDSISGEIVSTTAFVVQKRRDQTPGVYIDLTEGDSEAEKLASLLKAAHDLKLPYVYVTSSRSYAQIPGSPVAYWAPSEVSELFARAYPFEDVAETRKGMVTARNDVYVRDWHEVSQSNSGLDRFEDRESAAQSGRKWFSYLKGGGFRKWYGNKFDVVDWENDGRRLQNTMHPTENRVWATNFNLDYIFSPNVNWGAISSTGFSARVSKGGELFDAGGSACFPTNMSSEAIAALLNSPVTALVLRALNPTLNFQAGNIGNLPLLDALDCPDIRKIVSELIEIHKQDWDSRENSWDFQSSTLIPAASSSLESEYAIRSSEWNERVTHVNSLEVLLNQRIIETYQLKGVVDAGVPIQEITLEVNPAYRYGSDKSESELESLRLADTMCEFISYAVGCMLGRYSLNKPGLILANQGETADDYRRLIPSPTFEPDEDNVLPLLDGDWFEDDITERFKAFLKVTFSTENYEANLKFLEDALYPDNLTAKKRKTLRDYFLKDFYNHHIKLYKKRPIYWLFSSPKGTFNALIYMHRYRPDTVGTVLHYLREFRDKLTHHADHQQMLADSASASKSEKTQAIKDVAAIKKQLKELEDYEKTLFAVAARKIDIDLDDGVKHNYLLFGSVLRKIPGLDAKDD